MCALFGYMQPRVTAEATSNQIILLFRGQDKHQGGSSLSKQNPVNLIQQAVIESLLFANILVYSFLNSGMFQRCWNNHKFLYCLWKVNV